MTSSFNGSTARLDRIERILEETALRTQANARAIEADCLALRNTIEDVVAMITTLAEEGAEEREAMKRKQVEADQRFEILLAEMRADREQNDREHEAFRREHEVFRQAIRGLLERQE